MESPENFGDFPTVAGSTAMVSHGKALMGPTELHTDLSENRGSQKSLGLPSRKPRLIEIPGLPENDILSW